MPKRGLMLLSATIAMFALIGCDLRFASFDYPVKGGAIRVRQTRQDIAFAFVDELGTIHAEDKRSIPYGTATKQCYAIVDNDEIVLLLEQRSIINRLPRDKADESVLLQNVLGQIVTVAYSRQKNEFVSLDFNRIGLALTDHNKRQILSSIERIDIHEPVDGKVVAVLHNFPSLVTVIIGNQTIESDAFEIHHLPSSIRTLDISHCRRILNPNALVSELNASGVTALWINKDQEKTIADKLHLKVMVVSPD